MKTVLYLAVGCFTALFVLPAVTVETVKHPVALEAIVTAELEIPTPEIKRQETKRDSLATEILITVNKINLLSR